MPTVAVAPYADDDLQRRVINFYYRSGLQPLRGIQVNVQSGVVTLTGEVPSFYIRQLCLSFCQRVAGVLRVEDRIQVAERS